MITYKTIDIHSEDLLAFRFNIQRNELDKEYRYWFSERKLRSSDIYNLEGAYLDDKLISVSATTLYNQNTLRIGQFHYTLPEYRQHRDFMCAKEGFIKRHKDTAQLLDKNTLLVAIHAFNRKTEQMLNVWLHRRHRILWFKEFDYVGKRDIKNKEQHCFEYRY